MTQGQRPSHGGVRAGRRAVVTGGTGGIGVAIGSALLAAGHEVTLVDVRPLSPEGEALFKTRGHLPCFYAGDLSRDEQRAQLAEEVQGVDILVNNAAIYPRALIAQLTPEETRTVLEVNLVAAIDLMSRYGPGMAERGWGRIVNVTSVTALAGMATMSAYAASKAGLMAASMVAATELGPRNVTVNCVSPGAIPTAAEPAGTDDADVLAIQRLPFRGEPADIAAMVLFLSGDDARFVTGQTVRVDGGWRTA